MYNDELVYDLDDFPDFVYHNVVLLAYVKADLARPPIVPLRVRRGIPRAEEPVVALFVYPKHATRIFEHGKTWEIRGEKTHKRSRIAIFAAGTGQVVGEVTIRDCCLVGVRSPETGEVEPPPGHGGEGNFIWRPEHADKHQLLIPGGGGLPDNYKTIFAWVLDEPLLYKHPVPFRLPRGAQKWVHLDQEAISLIKAAREDMEDGGAKKEDPSNDTTTGPELETRPCEWGGYV